MHLLDRGMVEFAAVPKTGKVVLRAKGAKEEFSRFIAQLNDSYQHEEITVTQLLCFAYGVTSWELDPAALQGYARGLGVTEIHTDGFDVYACDGKLEGDPEEIEKVIREAFGCLEVTNA